MPTYTYKCTACDEMIEKRQSFSDAPLTTCEQCGGALRKVIHPVGIVFKGSGWYITDSRSSSSTSANGVSSSSEASTPKTETAAKKESSSASSGDSGTSKTANASGSSSASTKGGE